MEFIFTFSEVPVRSNTKLVANELETKKNSGVEQGRQFCSTELREATHNRAVINYSWMSCSSAKTYANHILFA